MSTKQIKINKQRKYDLLYGEFKKSVINENNREKINFLCRKVKDFNTIADKISKKSKASASEKYLSKVYIFIYLYRLLEIDKYLTTQENDIIEELQARQVDFVKNVCQHYGLDKEETQEMHKAYNELSEPVTKKSPLGIKIGHDAILSILAENKITKYLSSLFTEFNFYFPNLSQYIGINNNLIEYISKSKFHTAYTVEKHLAKKIKNKAKLIKHVQKLKTGASILNNKHAMTMIKTSSRNQVDIVSIADKKAGIMITVNSILLTLLIPMFASYIFDFSSFIIPISILIVTNGLTILLATLATRPSTTKEDKITNEKIHSGQKSLFYFKNFAQLSKNEFVDKARDLLTKENAFEQSVFTDLYDVGVDLDRKYKRLRWCYTIFGCGIILTMLSFIIVIIFSSI